MIPRFIREWLVKRQVSRLLRAVGIPARIVEGVMSGWKTWVGGLSLIVAGLGKILGTIKAGEYNFSEVQEGLALIGAGFAAIGIGHKVEVAGEKAAGK